MNKTKPIVTKKETTDLPTLVTVICHFMTLYAMRPCQSLAININRHLKVMLNSSTIDSLGEWKETFQQLLTQWVTIAKQHAQNQVHTATIEAQQTVSH